MYLIFLEDSNEIKPLFAYSDKDVCMSRCISINTIKNLLKEFLPETSKIKIHYAGSYSFKDADKGSFYALVKVINNSVDGILRVSDESYDMKDYCELLNSENTMENREYKIFEFRGTLKE